MKITLKEPVEELLALVPEDVQKKIHIIASSRRNRQKAEYDDMVQEGLLAWLETEGETTTQRKKAIGQAISRLCYDSSRGHAPLNENHPDLTEVVEHSDLREALAALPETNADVLSRYYLQGQSYSQITRHYQKTGQWAKRMIEKSLEKMRAHINK